MGDQPQNVDQASDREEELVDILVLNEQEVPIPEKKEPKKKRKAKKKKRKQVEPKTNELSKKETAILEALGIIK